MSLPASDTGISYSTTITPHTTNHTTNTIHTTTPPPTKLDNGAQQTFTSTSSIEPQPPLPDIIIQSYDSALQYIGTMNTTTHPVPELRVERVNQLDAHTLDSELQLILSSTYKRIFKYFDWYYMFSSYQIELNTILQYMIYRYTVLRDLPTPANKLQNLILRSETNNYIDHININEINISKKLQLYTLSYKQKQLYVILNVVVPYIWHRMRHYLTMSAYGGYSLGTIQRTMYNIYGYCDTIYNTASLFNLISFMHNSRYSTLADRMLSLRYVYIRARVNRQISFDFMNQQLAWNTLIEFIMYIYPFITSTINAIQLKSYLSTISLLNNNTYSTTHSDHTYTLQTTCPICSAQPCNIPYQSSCGCIYCYYCIASNKMATSRMVCNRCTKVITSYQPYKASIETT